MQIENEASFKKRLNDRIGLFLGAGFSILAKDKTGNSISAGGGLRDDLCAHFRQPELKSLDLAVVSQILRSQFQEEFTEYLTGRYSVGDFSPLYNGLKNASIDRIFTTNIDDLIFKIFQDDPNRYVNDLLLRGQSYRDRSAIEYLALHGSVVHPENYYTFTPIEISSAFSDNPTQFQYLTKSMSDSAMLFWGYSLADAGALQALNPHYRSGPNAKPRWIVLRAPSDGEVSYFKSLGFQIIVADTEEMLHYLLALSSTEKSSPSTLSIGDFLTGRIPSVDEVPVRAIDEFFKGAAPSWHDVLTARIPTTRHYHNLINTLDQDLNVMISGIPASGKSTLLMQAAAYYETPSIKIFETSISPEKAKSIVAKVAGRGKAIIFLDSMSDSVEALDILTSCKDIRVIGADRSTNIGFGSHLFNANKFTRFDCTEVEDGDLRVIYQKIPPAIRNENMTIPNIVEQDASPSVFEFIQANVRGKNIEDRYRDVLAELKNNSLELHDLFVMICYIFHCHAPVSFDVISRFIEAKGDYQKVYGAVERLGKLLNNTDVAGDSFLDLDDTQDHFVPRSMIVAEIVVGKCRNEDFHRIFSNFHTRVPTLFVPNFSTFKRYGYRNQLVEKAFPDWRDGEAFYLKAYREDRSYFLKQQLSIYMGAKKQYERAFQYIDEALVASRNKNANIRHTHARLLFDANIEKVADNPDLRTDLRRSMEILESCHEYDKRQTNHSQRFADQSIRYWDVFGDAESRDYMVKAKSWLDEEITKIPSLRYARHLRRDLLKRL